MSESPFAQILRDIVGGAPGGKGSSLTASDGETVDSAGPDREGLAAVSAHASVVVRQVRAALRTFHFGDPVELLVLAEHGAIVIRALPDGYFALLEVGPGASLGQARRALERAVEPLGAELG